MSVVARTRNGGETEGLGDILPRLTCFAAWKDNGYYVVRYPGGATSSCPSPRRRTPVTTPVTPATPGMTRFRSTSSKVSNLENRERPPSPPYPTISDIWERSNFKFEAAGWWERQCWRLVSVLVDHFSLEFLLFYPPDLLWKNSLKFSELSVKETRTAIALRIKIISG